ncbi:MAG: hypothetical protein R3E95_16285 [Thiolinea sp.]
MAINRSLQLAAALACMTLANLGTAAESADPILYIAGTHPAERPAAAPVLTEVHKDGAWYEQALHGVEKSYPYSLRFLEDQGNWFSPFIHPGMTPPYDLRHWHSQP